MFQIEQHASGKLLDSLVLTHLSRYVARQGQVYCTEEAAERILDGKY